ncbi:sodium- and chloride-dependent neutral and basic amino acid transporter B(0+)-like isoform X2 [Zonotrichia albicollis]|uniref:sodium- and chloride-dependent neutral and basic amino acid transporter B(0+)-like isoform X2 n=1 Tax=Zonotrichia albicollis TaxID=44394 RepID=UPI003D80B8DE
MVGYAVGLGNVWRFPYLAYQNGGGAFLIPYTFMLALAGLPLFFMECSLGQFASQGPILIWRMLPLFQGVGITMVILTAFVTIYYNVIIAYALFYFFASFQKVLPWSDCFSWADELCSKTQKVNDCNTTFNGNVIRANYTFVTDNNLTCIEGTITYKPVQFPTEQYWNKVALQRSSGLEETGRVVWYLALCLLLAWIIVAGALYKGIKSSGKVVYFTALFPYVILFILLVRGATLEGALDGVQYYIGRESNITKLMEAEVWKAAATQIFFSLSTGWGGLVALSSYNRFHNNCYTDAIIVCVVNCGTSVFAGFAIFSILGHMAHVSQRPVSEVVDSGRLMVTLLVLGLALAKARQQHPSLHYFPGFDLAFVAYPEALTQLPVSTLWSILFFMMLVLLGLDSQFALIETVITSIQDINPTALKKYRGPITVGVCAVLFLFGLVCVTQAGVYWVNLIDHFCAGWGILISASLEIVGISHIYGGRRFIEDIEMMIGKKTNNFWLWWKMCWFYVTPVLLLAVLIWSLMTFSNPTYGSIIYPAWGNILGWCMIIFSIMWIPVIAIVKLYRAEGTLLERLVSCCRPAANWGPYLECHRGERYSHMADPTRKEEKEDENPPPAAVSDK